MNEPSQERADPSARSLGSLFCNIHFVSNSIKLRQLYVTEFATDENQFFQPIKYELGKVLCMFLCLSRCVFHWGFLRPTLEFRFFIFFFDFLFPQSRLLSRSSWVTMNRFFQSIHISNQLRWAFTYWYVAYLVWKYLQALPPGVLARLRKEAARKGRKGKSRHKVSK